MKRGFPLWSECCSLEVGLKTKASNTLKQTDITLARNCKIKHKCRNIEVSPQSSERGRQKRVDRYASIIQTNGTSLPTVAKIHTYNIPQSQVSETDNYLYVWFQRIIWRWKVKVKWVRSVSTQFHFRTTEFCCSSVWQFQSNSWCEWEVWQLRGN